MFKDVDDVRIRKFIFQLSDREREFLKKEAQKHGIHVSVLVRRCLRVALIDKPDLFNIFE